LGFNQRAGNLSVRINGKEIHKGAVSATMNIPFKNFTQVENKITLEAIGSAKFLGDANVVNYFKTQNVRRIEKPFSLNTTQFSQLPGLISFRVVAVDKPGGLNVKIENNGTKLISYQLVTERTYNIPFGNTTAKLGNNKLIIEAVDGAEFYVKDVGVWT